MSATTTGSLVPVLLRKTAKNYRGLCRAFAHLWREERATRPSAAAMYLSMARERAAQAVRLERQARFIESGGVV